MKRCPSGLGCLTAGLVLCGLVACGIPGDEYSSGACESGATRKCTGPAACKGGQTCGPDSAWTPCDCSALDGGSGDASAGSSGSGGLALQDGGSGSAGIGGGGKGGGAAGGGGADGSGGVAGQAGISGSGGMGGAGGGAAGAGGSGGKAGSGGAAGAGGSCPCGPNEQCDGSLCVARLVQVPLGFSIDATEVTRSQYAAWLATNPSPPQPDYCTWNTLLSPDSDCMASDSVCHGSGCGSHPQVCLDWCDAFAYCTGVGKRLCGNIGGGSILLQQDPDYDGSSQWYLTCSSAGQNPYPYGISYDDSACNGSTNGLETTLPVASLPTCQSSVSGYAGVYDLNGNVWEWEDACISYHFDFDQCAIRGDSYLGNSFDMSCNVVDMIDRDSVYADTGFRCCSN